MLISMFMFVFCFSAVLYMWYHGNKPIFTPNYIKDDFEDQITGLFPAGWMSGANPFNIEVVNDNGNKVMEIEDKMTDDPSYTEIARKFKKTIRGIIKCRVKALDVTKSGFVIHIPQLDREYDPHDDIVILFLKGDIYVIGDENIIQVDNDDSFWSFLVLPDGTWLIDEWTIEDYDAVASYDANTWILVEISFDRSDFFLTIDGNSLGRFSYPLYNPPYFAGVYFQSLIAPAGFSFYVDDVEITLSEPVDYIHPLNVAFILLMVFFLSMIVLIYSKFSKLKKCNKKRKK